MNSVEGNTGQFFDVPEGHSAKVHFRDFLDERIAFVRMKVSVKAIAEFVIRRRIKFFGHVTDFVGVGSIRSPEFRTLPIPFVERESREYRGNVFVLEIESMHSNVKVMNKVGVKFVIRSHLAGNVVSFTRPENHFEKCLNQAMKNSSPTGRPFMKR